MGHTMSLEGALNLGCEVLIVAIDVLALAGVLCAGRVRQGNAMEGLGGIPMQLQTSLDDMSLTVPTLPKILIQQTQHTSSTCACISDTPHVDPLSETEEDSKGTAADRELLQGIGTVFAAEEEIQSPAQALDEVDGGDTGTDAWSTTLQNKAEVEQVPDRCMNL